MASEAEIVVIRRVGQLDGPEDHTHYRQSLDIRQDSLEARTAFRRETMAFKFENVALRPLSQLGGTEPNGRYSPSLEAQGNGPEVRSGLRRWIQALYGARMVPDDVVEEQLRIAIEESGPEVYDPETGNRMNKERHQLRYLLNDYERFKHRMDTRVCRGMFRCYTLTDGTHNGGVQSHLEITQAKRFATFSETTTALMRTLCSPCPGGLRVLALTFDPLANEKTEDSLIYRQKSFFTATHRLTTTFRPETLLIAPNDIIAFLFARHLKMKARPSLGSRKDPHENDITRELLLPPSLTRQLGNFDPTQFDHNHIILAWQGKAPVYKDDLDIFLYEQYKTLPEPRRAVITLYHGTGEKETSLLTLFSHSDSLRFFSNRLEQEAGVLETPREPESSPDGSSGSSVSLEAGSQSGSSAEDIPERWSATSETVRSILLAYEAMIHETQIFVQGCSIELEKLNLEVRQAPSAGKLRYLVHLEDCRALAYEGVDHGLQVLDSLHTWIEDRKSLGLWDGRHRILNAFDIWREASEWYRKRLSVIGDKIKELKNTLQEHLALTSARRNYILSIVAAFYVVLSFTTSFFGMNMNTSTPVGPQGFTDWATTWINSSPADVQNSTRALVSTINSAGIQSYPWKTFGITAGSLLATIPLALGAGGAVRAMWQIIMFFRIYWRILAVPPSMLFVGFSIFGTYNDNFAGWLLWFTTNVLLAIFMVWRSAFACWSGLPREGTWFVAAVITVVSLTISWFVRKAPMMMLPWAFFAQDWARPHLRRWWRKGVGG